MTMARGAALITGASSGIGRELARLCAAAGYGVTVVARSSAPLEAFAAELARAYDVPAHPIAADLSDPDAPNRLYQAAGNNVEILINNAGFGLQGAFAETEWKAEREMIEVNITAVVRLTKLYLPGMIARRSGRILNVASTAAFVPGPYMAVYYATKAFLLSFSEAVATEVRGTGVTVTALCPGPTRTGFFQTAGATETNLFKGPTMDAAEVARVGYEAMMAGKLEAIAGKRNLWTIRAARLFPRGMLANLTRRLNSRAES
jgi:hypothetical protein